LAAAVRRGLAKELAERYERAGERRPWPTALAGGHERSPPG